MKRRGVEADGRPLGSRERRSRSGTPWRPRRLVKIVRVQRPGLRELPAAVVAKLGTMSDAKLARRAGVHPNTIHHERRARGIAAFQRISPPVKWTAARIRTLGSASDREVAAELGVSVYAVSRKRRLLGIPPFHPRRSFRAGYDWRPEDLRRLGKMPDRALARELGVSTGVVFDQRTIRRIPPYRPKPPAVKWTKAMLRLVGRIPDEVLARRFGISGSTVIQKRRRLGRPPLLERRPVEHSAELLEALKLPMTEARRRTGLSTNSVRDLQKRYGLRPPRASELRYTKEVVRRMGRESDEAIAADLGVSSSAVRWKRRSLGIPAYDAFRHAPRGKRRRP